MRVSLEWLRDWVDVSNDGGALAEELTTLGLEVDDVLAAAPGLSGIVVARVAECRPHPNADKLSLCIVDDGTARHEVVCGAPNVRADVVAAYAPVGARLPDGRTIEAAKLRGIVSHGMLCSSRELGLAEDVDGILILEDSAVLGTPLIEHLALDDAVLDIDLTPNRGDCFSVLGIAREIAAKRGVDLRGPAMPSVLSAIVDTFPVELAAPAACPRFVGRVVRGVGTGLRSPLWLRERLRRAGLRAIHPVVDVTNYVMLELGQPLHAYDLAKLAAPVTPRLAKAGEALELLDGQTIELAPDVLVIADASGPIGLAGIMGGAGTAVGPDTTDIFLEAAFFTPAAIAGRARRYGLHTDASVRFERGVDPAGQMRAIERATALLVDIAGGNPGPLAVTERIEQLPKREAIRLTHARIETLLGVEIGGRDIENLLTRLGIELRTCEGGWDATPPPYRFDLQIEVDLVEEVGRLLGYDRIPAVTGQSAGHLGKATEQRIDEDELADLLVARGYTEVITYGFVDRDLDEAVSPNAARIALANPISSDMNVMRSSLWPGLLLVARQNLSRQRERLRIFEIGREFTAASGQGPQHEGRREDRREDRRGSESGSNGGERIGRDLRAGGGGIIETEVIAGLAVGAEMPEHWDTREREVDFFDVKADVESLLKPTGRLAEFRFEAAAHPALRPGRSARIALGEETVGWLGAIHPELQRKLDLRRPVQLFSLDLSKAAAAEVPAYRPYSRFPSVRRDLAVVVPIEVSADSLMATVRSAAGDLLQRVTLFDVYTGQGIEPGRKSVALGLILQGVSRTLTDADADRAVHSVTRSLEREHGATIRSQ